MVNCTIDASVFIMAVFVFLVRPELADPVRLSVRAFALFLGNPNSFWVNHYVICLFRRQANFFVEIQPSLGHHICFCGNVNIFPVSQMGLWDVCSYQFPVEGYHQCVRWPGFFTLFHLWGKSELAVLPPVLVYEVVSQKLVRLVPNHYFDSDLICNLDICCS